ncbi:MAG: Ig-like domain repeat protein, partial [Bdellovibrionales bacterium]|nr:Ig-like domain repeat protein [Bdellovibrionales bacterium]
MRTSVSIFCFFVGLGISVMFAFQNCSKVNFETDLGAIRDKLNAQGGILINNDEPYTTSEAVVLSIANLGADEMYVTDDKDCGRGGEWQPVSAQLPWKLSAENKKVAVYAKFREKGLQGADSKCYSDDITHDNIAPSVRITEPVKAYINSANATLGFIAEDTGSGVKNSECSVNGGSAQVCLNSYSASGLREGTQSIEIVAYDNAGNKSSPGYSNFMVDMTAPIVNLNKTPPAVTNQSQFQFEFTATDAGSGIDGFQCSVANAAFVACSSPYSVNLPEGNQTFQVRAIDKAGNVSDIKKYDWKIDLSIPTTIITQAPPP